MKSHQDLIRDAFSNLGLSNSNVGNTAQSPLDDRIRRFDMINY